MQKDKRNEAIKLRIEERLSLNEVSAKLGISKSTASMWLRDYPLSKNEIEYKIHKGVDKAQATRLIKRQDRQNLLDSMSKITLKQSTTKKQGDVGMGSAIGWLTTQGYTVCVPLTDSQAYDLVAEIDNNLKRVQVKTTNKIDRGHYLVTISSAGGHGNGKWKRYLFDSAKVDYLFVLTGHGDKYFIPTTEITTVNAITLNSSWDRFKITT